MNNNKLNYEPPIIELIFLEMEQGIAAGSVKPTNTAGEIKEEWEEDNDDFREIPW